MASIARDPNGHRRILFVAPDGKRKAIRIGKCSQRAAESIKFRVEELVAAQLTGHPWNPTRFNGSPAWNSNWLTRLPSLG